MVIPVPVLGLALAGALVIGSSLATALVCLLVAVAGAARSMARRRPWTLADDITTVRLGLIMVFTALLHADDGRGFGWPTVLIGAVALALDAGDGLVARATSPTAAGARYDEAVDAVFVLVLSIALVPVWGWWCLLPGLLHYLYRLVGLVRPAWRRRLPPSLRRKVIAAAQGVLLLTAGSPPALAGPGLGWLVAALALAALVCSFALDIAWLERSRRRDDAGASDHGSGAPGPRGPCESSSRHTP